MSATISTGQPFLFAPENRERAERIIARYPKGRQHSAIIPLLDLAQRQNGGWLSHEAIAYVAELLEMAPIRAVEVATFYTMFNLKPVGRHLIQVCRTTPCWLRGSDELTHTCLAKLGVAMKEVTPASAPASMRRSFRSMTTSMRILIPRAWRR
jgi:NADH:ubiquinone oxidoreductase subunit E